MSSFFEISLPYWDIIVNLIFRNVRSALTGGLLLNNWFCKTLKQNLITFHKTK
ncbi:hypothetical protein HanHA300_Chr16g0621571 [Helianthus annuus]|nr:hypothetical protein HanHA300_Chr16g0621571 [Helianthus annuus]KAJ0461457.1 hypothetical protein HanHA89_Chr16g0672471 [Helianthus annuus]KAJ0822307.1 hypothetical protein HanPSC8_Chr16g0730481 [Helianthus annuus]